MSRNQTTPTRLSLPKAPSSYLTRAPPVAQAQLPARLLRMLYVHCCQLDDQGPRASRLQIEAVAAQCPDPRRVLLAAAARQHLLHAAPLAFYHRQLEPAQGGREPARVVLPALT